MELHGLYMRDQPSKHPWVFSLRIFDHLANVLTPISVIPSQNRHSGLIDCRLHDLCSTTFDQHPAKVSVVVFDCAGSAIKGYESYLDRLVKYLMTTPRSLSPSPTTTS